MQSSDLSPLIRSPLLLHCLFLFAEKSGVCPVPATGFGVGLCHHFCFNDMDCPETEKCCHNGCGYECRAPYKEKPGRCPPINGPTTCDEACAQDWQCPGTQKCCKTCGHVKCNNTKF
uniref:WAP domain-containing protein n=1 Tax=Cyclopterus lumpus TaxID=8103 RepID=A0A8C2X2K5_CYCLU